MVRGRWATGLQLALEQNPDLILLDPEAENLHPCFDLAETIAYAAEGLNVRLTMVDGKVLYRDGEFLTLDAERVRANFDRCSKALVGEK